MKSRFAICLALSAALIVPAFAQDNTVGTTPVFTVNAPPTNGANEVDTITIGGTPTGGTFTVAVTGGRTTQAITWSATNATLVANIQAALVALPNIGTGGATVAVGTATAGIGTFTVTFNGTNSAATDFPALTIGTNGLTGTSPTVAVATTTAGVAATFKTARPGTLLIDRSVPTLYFNASATVGAPNWTAVTIP